MSRPEQQLSLKPGPTIPLEEFLERGEDALATTPPEAVMTIQGKAGTLRVLSAEAYEQMRESAQWVTTAQERLAEAQAAAEAYRADPTPGNETTLRQALEGLADLQPRASSAMGAVR